jgi:menaquinone-dependent protoporphyrinogen oxidase
MDLPILVAYATKHGSTREVAEAVVAALESRGVPATALEAASVHRLDGYGAVVLGAPVYMGHWHADARSFLSRHRRALEVLPVFVFALGPMHEKAEEFAQAEAVVRKALQKKARGVEVRDVKIFGGAVDPEHLSFPFNKMPAMDIRDWPAIEEWAAGIATACSAETVPA